MMCEVLGYVFRFYPRVQLDREGGLMTSHCAIQSELQKAVSRLPNEGKSAVWGKDADLTLGRSLYLIREDFNLGQH